jgi:hypothetical protein
MSDDIKDIGEALALALIYIIFAASAFVAAVIWRM